MKSILIFLSIIAAACGYKILCYQSVPSKSHYHLMKGIVKPLLEAGHQVTFITTFPDSKSTKNLKEIDISHVEQVSRHIDMTGKENKGLDLVRDFGRNITLAVMKTQTVKDVLVKENFDAVISEWFFSDVEAGLAAVQQVPWILLSGMTLHTHIEGVIDAVRSVPTVPSINNDSPEPMSLWARIKNTFSYFYLMYYASISNYYTVRSDYETMFAPLAAARGVTLPPFSDALHNISILLLNSHPSFAPALSLPPNVVDIGGYHIDENVPALPKDLQDIMDSSKGVVYFSMGSVLKSSNLPEKTKRDLLKVFGELPYTVLWKFEENLDNLPKNVHIRPWMPQASILAHKNLKAFITHGGLLSTLESLHFGVPLIAVPVFGDQPSNSLRAVRAGYALKVNFSPDMADELKVALDEMLTNNNYYERAKYLSKLFRNRPVSNKVLIQHYVELAIESKGAVHLRSKTHLYKWYELWMLDQLAVLLAVLYVIYSIIRKTVNLLIGKKPVKGKKEKKR